MSGLNLPVVRLPVPEIQVVKVLMSEFLTQTTAKSRKRIGMKLRHYIDPVKNQLTEETGCRYRVGFRRSGGSKPPFSRFFVFLVIFEAKYLGIQNTKWKTISQFNASIQALHSLAPTLSRSSTSNGGVSR